MFLEVNSGQKEILKGQLIGIVTQEKQERVGGVEMYKILNRGLQAHVLYRMSLNCIKCPIKGIKFLPYKGVCELTPWANAPW